MADGNRSLSAIPTISVIFSFRNEESNLTPLIERTVAAVKDVSEDYEIIFVNDDSDDKSLEIITRHGLEDPRIKTINMSRRFGVGPCILAGFEYAKGETVVYLDSDLQDPPEVICKMIEKWQQGYEIVYGIREKRKEGFLKVFCYWLLFQI